MTLSEDNRKSAGYTQIPSIREKYPPKKQRQNRKYWANSRRITVLQCIYADFVEREEEEEENFYYLCLERVRCLVAFKTQKLSHSLFALTESTVLACLVCYSRSQTAHLDSGKMLEVCVMKVKQNHCPADSLNVLNEANLGIFSYRFQNILRNVVGHSLRSTK